MKRFLAIIAVLFLSTVVCSQNKVLDWTQLMDYKLYPQQTMRGFVFKGNSVIYSKYGQQLLFGGKEERELNDGEVEYYSDQTRKTENTRAKIKDGDLYVDNKLVDTADGYNIVLGESVHRNEFGIDGGLFWSPKGNRLAFYRMDQSMVKDYPIVNTKARQADKVPDGWNEEP